MRASSILLAAASLLAASTNAQCGQLAPSEIAILAHCGNVAELTECLTPGDRCVKKCLAQAGCSDAEAKSFVKWFHNDCKETRTFGDLRKRQKNNNEGQEGEGEGAAADAETTLADDPGTRKAQETTEAANPGTTAPAETAAETTAPVATEAEPAASTVTSVRPDQTVVADVTDASGKTVRTTAAASIADAAKPLVCLTTTFTSVESCSTDKVAKTTVCVPTQSPIIKCADGLLCQMTSKGSQICMIKRNAPDMAGIIVTCCLAIFLATMMGTVIFMACKTKKEQEFEKKQAEALAIANGLKAPGPGGAAATDAYVPLIGGGSRGRTRDSSANPFGNDGSARNSRRPSTLGLGAASPSGYGGMSEGRSPIDSRAPSPLGMPGATEDLSYGGGRRI